MRFLTQARETYGKFITILFRYKINQTETNTVDGSIVDVAILNTTSNGQHLIPWDRQHLRSVSGYGHFTPYENDDHFVQAFILDALHVLSCLSCTSTLQVTSFRFHFA